MPAQGRGANLKPSQVKAAPKPPPVKVAPSKNAAFGPAPGKSQGLVTAKPTPLQKGGGAPTAHALISLHSVEDVAGKAAKAAYGYGDKKTPYKGGTGNAPPGLAVARPVSPKFSKAASKDVVAMGEFPFVGGYKAAEAGVEAAKGNTKPAKELGKGLFQGLKHGALGELAQGHIEGAEKAAQEHPGFTLAETAGAVSAAGRGAGALARGAKMGFAQRIRSPIALETHISPEAARRGEGLKYRTFSGDLTRKAVQVRSDLGREPLRDSNGHIVTVKDRNRNVPVLLPSSREAKRFQEQRANFTSARAVGMQRSARQEATHAALEASTAPGRLPIALRSHLKPTIKGALRPVHVQGKMMPLSAQNVSEHLAQLVASGTIRPDHFAEDLQSHIERIRAAVNNPKVFRAPRKELATAEGNLALLEAAASHPSVINQAERIATQGRMHGRQLNAYDKKLAENQVYPAEQLERARLSEYALAHMDARQGTVATQTRDVPIGEPSGPYNPTPAAINSRTFYHGTGKEGLTPKTIESSGTNIQNLFGQGIYLTDKRSIAAGYARNKGRMTPKIYSAKLHVRKVLDLEAAPDKVFVESLAKRAEHLVGIGDAELAKAIRAEARRPGATGDSVYETFRHGVSDFSHAEEIPRAELVEDFQILSSELREHGYDALTHIGGKRTGHEPHQVVVLLDPADIGAHGEPNPVQKFEIAKPPRTRTEITNAEEAGREGFLGPNGKLITNDEIKAHMEAHGVDPKEVAYLPHRMVTAESKKSFYKPFVPGRRLVGNEPTRTGALYKRGATAMTNTMLHEELANKATTLANVHQFDRMIRDQGRLHPAMEKAAMGEKMSPAEQQIVKEGGYFNAKEAGQWADKLEEEGFGRYVPMRAFAAKLSADAQKNVMEAQAPSALENVRSKMLNDRIVHEGDTSTARNVTLVPEDYANRLMQQAAPVNFQPIRMLQMLNNPFRMAVLAQPKWLTGNFVEPYFVRLPLSGSGVNIPGLAMDLRAGTKVMAELEKQDPQAAAEVRSVFFSGRFLGGKQATVRRTTFDVPGTAFMQKLPVVKQFGHLLALYPKAFFAFNRIAIEDPTALAALGKQARHDIQAATGHWTETFKLGDAAMKDVAKGLVNTANQHRYAEYYWELLGQYDGYKPWLKQLIQTATPFLPWTLASLRFVYWTLPAHHTVAFAGLTKTAQSVIKEWEGEHKDFGKPSPGELKYFPRNKKGGYVPVPRFTPFGISIPASQGPASAITQVEESFLPQVSGAIEAFKGKDPWGRPLQVPKTPTNKKGEASESQKFQAGLYGMLEALIPMVSTARRLQEKGGTAYATSTVLNPQVKPGTDTAMSAFERTFNPFRPTYLKPPKGSKPKKAPRSKLGPTGGSSLGPSGGGGLGPSR